MKRFYFVLSFLIIPTIVSAIGDFPLIKPKPRTYTARTDSAIIQPLLPPPDMSTGKNTVITDSRYNNVRMARITDGTSGNGRNIVSFQVTETGEQRVWSHDSKFLIVSTAGGERWIFHFDPKTMQASQSPLSFQGPLNFSWLNSTILFHLHKTEIHEIVISSDATKVVSDTIIFNYINGSTGTWGMTTECLPSGFNETWTSTFIQKHDDKTFVVAYSTTGGQGSGHYIAAYQVGKGCRVMDTATGQITGQWGQVGNIDDGVNPLIDRFYLHEAGIGQNPQFAVVGATLHQPNGNPGCIAGTCLANDPYIWEIPTTHLRPCGPYKCDGHSAKGFSHTVTGHRGILHFYSDPSKPLTPLTPYFQYDDHGAWNNSGIYDLNPTFFVHALVSKIPVITYDATYENEVTAFPMDGSLAVYRFGQTMNSGSSPYYAIQNALGVVDDNGDHFAFGSDWQGTLGIESDGKTPRADVFVMELK